MTCETHVPFITEIDFTGTSQVLVPRDGITLSYKVMHLATDSNSDSDSESFLHLAPPRRQLGCLVALVLSTQQCNKAIHDDRSRSFLWSLLLARSSC